MRQYLDLLQDVRSNGKRRPTRATLKATGRHPDAFSVFGRQIRFNLGDGFPLVTTKRVPWKSIVHELLWFIKGDTNVQYLHDHGVSIWDEWANETGELGPIYGKQWRSWPDYSGNSIDQLAAVVAGIKREWFGRRHVVSAWNVAQIPQMALPPCHVLFQFFVADGELSCQLYQRSADLFLGVPFNIASYSLLTTLVAHATGLRPGEFVHTFGDVHLYDNQLEAADEQLSRTPHPLPTLKLAGDKKDLDAFTFDDIHLEGYVSDKPIPVEVAV